MFIGNKIRSTKFYFGYAQSAGNSFISNIPLNKSPFFYLFHLLNKWGLFIIYYMLTNRKKSSLFFNYKLKKKQSLDRKDCFKEKNKVNFTRTSETLRKKKIKNEPHFSQFCSFSSFSLLKTSGKVRSHVPTHRKPLTNEEFGYYLAGLIDGDGCFTEKSLLIAFSEKDTSLAYYLKSYIAYGNVYKIKNKKAVVFTIAHSKGLIKVLSLVNGKLRYESKINNVNNKLIPYLNSLRSNPSLDLISLEKTNDLNNHWFAGFSDADASFQIKILERKKLDKIRTEVRLNFQIDQKTSKLLNLIKQNFGGNIGYREKQNSYYYGSTSFKVGKNFIKYFDSYHLLSSKYINFLKWRKAYLIIQDKAHLTVNGLEKIKKLKSTLNK